MKGNNRRNFRLVLQHSHVSLSMMYLQRNPFTSKSSVRKVDSSFIGYIWFIWEHNDIATKKLHWVSQTIRQDKPVESVFT